MEDLEVKLSESDSKIVLRGSITDPCHDDDTNDTIATQFELSPLDDADRSLVIANQPRPSTRKPADKSFHSPFNDAHSERDWSTGLSQCSGEGRSWIYYQRFLHESMLRALRYLPDDTRDGYNRTVIAFHENICVPLKCHRE